MRRRYRIVKRKDGHPLPFVVQSRVWPCRWADMVAWPDTEMERPARFETEAQAMASLWHTVPRVDRIVRVLP